MSAPSAPAVSKLPACAGTRYKLVAGNRYKLAACSYEYRRKC
jgi:hypothetical protein